MSNRAFPAFIGRADKWRGRKRREWRAVEKALDEFALGSAFTPDYDEFRRIREAAKKMRYTLRGRWRTPHE